MVVSVMPPTPRAVAAARIGCIMVKSVSPLERRAMRLYVTSSLQMRSADAAKSLMPKHKLRSKRI